jgi:hypothetical protein
VLVSKVAIETANEQGGRGVVVGVVNETTPRIAVRVPEAPVLENGRVAEDISPAVSVNEVALPIVAPLAMRNEIVPVHDAAVPPDAFSAKFVTMISAVSVAPSPTGGRLKSRVLVVLVVLCANADVAATAATIKTRRLIDMCHLSSFMFDEASLHLLSGRQALNSCF